MAVSRPLDLHGGGMPVEEGGATTTGAESHCVDRLHRQPSHPTKGSTGGIPANTSSQKRIMHPWLP